MQYRLELPRDEVERMIAAGRYDLLLQFDQVRLPITLSTQRAPDPCSHLQLNAQKKHGLAFADFEESAITFPPTFKFDVGTDSYDTSCALSPLPWPR